MIKQKIIELIDAMDQDERQEFVLGLIERFNISIYPGDGDVTPEPEVMFSVTLTEVPDLARKEIVRVLRFYAHFSDLNPKELWDKTKELPWILMEEEYEDDVDEFCRLIEEAGGKVSKNEV